jgi:hypothetical protein
MTDQVIQFPQLYRIAFSDGERNDYVDGAKFRHYWEAEVALFELRQEYPELLFWISIPVH